MRKAADKRNWKRSLPLLAMMVPGCLYLLINNYLPMTGIVVAFKDYSPLDGIFGSAWIGLKNFEFLFRSSDLLYIMRNTLLYNTGFIMLNTVCSVGLAVLLGEITGKRAVRCYQTALLFPSLLSTVILGYLVMLFLDYRTGFLNRTVLNLLQAEPVSWYSEPGYWPFILLFVNTWRSVGKMSIIYYATIIGLDPQLHEAARIDGAGRLQRIRHVTLPQLAPMVIVMTTIAVGHIFTADFGLFYQVPLNSGALYETTNVLDTYVYRALIQLNDVGMASAAGVFQSLVGFVMVLATNGVLRRRSPENALF